MFNPFLLTLYALFLAFSSLSPALERENSQDVMRAKFLEYDEKQEYASGDTFESRVVIWPTRRNPEDFLILQGMVGNGLYLAKIDEVKRSKNNYEAIVLDGKFIITNNFYPQSNTISAFEDTQIVWELPDIIFLGGDAWEDDFEFVEQFFFSQRKLWPPFLLLLLVAFFFGGKYIKRYWILRKERIRCEREKKFWEERFILAAKRSDFEEVVANESKWEKFFPKTPPLAEFVENVKLIQYKKEWSASEHEKVKSLIDQIKEQLVGK